jgi:DMSO/TMAO reductase YedYZ heme-binding membrane subunit
VALGVALAAAVFGWSRGADAAEQWQFAARYTARWSFLILVPVFYAGPWQRLSPNASTRAIVRQRRALGLAFATAHGVHLAMLVRFQIEKSLWPDAVTLIGGGGAYLMLVALAATSNAAAVRRLGGRAWLRLHRVGVHWLWFVFTTSYAGRVVGGRLAFVPLLALALAGYGLRVAAWRARRASRSRAAAPAAAV